MYQLEWEFGALNECQSVVNVYNSLQVNTARPGLSQSRRQTEASLTKGITVLKC